MKRYVWWSVVCSLLRLTFPVDPALDSQALCNSGSLLASCHLITAGVEILWSLQPFHTQTHMRRSKQIHIHVPALKRIDTVTPQRLYRCPVYLIDGSFCMCLFVWISQFEWDSKPVISSSHERSVGRTLNNPCMLLVSQTRRLVPLIWLVTVGWLVQIPGLSAWFHARSLSFPFQSQSQNTAEHGT